MTFGLTLYNTISIHALREEGDTLIPAPDTPSAEISIHALREEGDDVLQSVVWPTTGFLSTPSVRRATGPGCRPVRRPEISIHALREEGDRLPQTSAPRMTYFYPRPP